MKNKNLKKLLSAVAVLAVSATGAISAISFTACSGNDNKATEAENEKLISVDKNHNSQIISTANGQIETKNSGKTYYVTPQGNQENDGLSWDKPLPIQYVLGSDRMNLQAGDTVYVQPGTYKISSTVIVDDAVSGTYDNYIRIVNAALEKEQSNYTGDEKIVTLDFSAQNFNSAARGVQINGSFIYWYGIDVCGAGDNGIYIGGSYNTVEYCEFYNNRDTGLQLGRAHGVDIDEKYAYIDSWPSYNLVKNCTSHNNYDNETYGENADGFAAKLTVGYGNVFDGCIAYRNSDDGWDLYAKSDSGNIGCVIIYNCVAFENGYIEYTQKENNDRFPTFNKLYQEPESDGRFFRTRDGDGNGFKLGGSVMEGDVVMYNCLSYYNRMHGVTDNSNPGFLKVEGVTSFDNSAAVDDNPNSATFGQIIKGLNHDKHGNIDVSRQTYSYNTVKNTLSVGSGLAESLDNDAYRGSVTDSILYAGKKQNIINGSIDADTKNGGKINTSTINALNASEIFKMLPIEYTVSESGNTQTINHKYNLSGLHDLYVDVEGKPQEGQLNPDRVHAVFRNEDQSINMGDILAKKEGVDDSHLLSGKTIGSTLNLSDWDSYEHFFDNELVDGSVANADKAKLERAYETLTINTDANAVYQDFEVPVKMNDCTIEWKSLDEETVVIGTDVENSISTSKYITLSVFRPLSEDKKVTIVATITCGTETKEKAFELNIKSGKPSIGKISVVTPDGIVIPEGGSTVIDQYAIYNEPTVQVENGIDYHGKLLKAGEQYTYTTSYRYATDKNSPSVQVKGFTPSNAGVYTITNTVTLTSDGSKKSMTYTLFVSSQSAKVDFVNGTDEVIVNRDGYTVSGTLSNATGMIYAISSNEEIEVTTANIKTLAGVESYSFRTDNVKFQFNNSNSNAYYIYYALSNLNGEITSDIYKKEVQVTDISTTSDFMKIAGGKKIADENPSTTIYRLTNDLDFSGVSYSKDTSGFTGLLNGAGHTVKNVTANNNGLFYKVEGGTIENIKFENIKIKTNTGKVGLVSTSYGGYFHNIFIKNIKVEGTERVGGLIGQAYEGKNGAPTYVSQISIVNDNSEEYFITNGTGKRAGGIIGLIQTSSDPAGDCMINISDCYVIANVSGSEQIGGVVGAFDNAKTNINYLLEITRCYFGGVASSTYATPRVGGIIGYQSGNVGYFVIRNCLSVGKLFTQGNAIYTSLKTASLIVGGSSSVAKNIVERCIANLQEYNSSYDVEYYTVDNLIWNRDGIKDIIFGGKYENYSSLWTFVEDNDAEAPNLLKAPYLVMNYVEG